MSAVRPHHGQRPPAALRAPRLPHPGVVTAAAALFLALAASVLAGVWAGGHAAAPTESPAPTEVRRLTAGPAQLAVPASWRRASLEAVRLPGLARASSAVRSLGPGAAGWAVATVAPADRPSLVPLVFRSFLQGPLPRPRETRLGGRGAWSYTGLATRDGRALALTVQPSTAGVLTVACVSRTSAPAANNGCAGAVSSATVPRATILAPSPTVALALGLGPRIEALDRARVKIRAQLSRAGSADAQARLARRLAGAHRSAADALAPLAATAGLQLVGVLGDVGRAYADLATAAAGSSRAGFSAARRGVDAEESRLAHAVEAVSARIEPKPAPALARVAPVPASRPSALLLLLAVVSLGAALALVYAPRTAGRLREARARPAARTARPSRPPRANKAPKPSGAAPRAAAAISRRSRVAEPSSPKPAPRRSQRAAPVAPAPRRKPVAERAAGPPTRPAPPAAHATPADPPAPARATPARLPPPHSSTGWTCEITWRAGLRAAAFHAVAAAPGTEPEEIARSSPVQWPPLIPPAPVPDLEEALRLLEERLIAAGWSPTGSDSRTRWYQRRFAWTGAGSPRPMPAASEAQDGWRCEIVWKAGLRGAGFYARATAHGEQQPLVVARSPKLEWPPFVPPAPDEELVAAACDVTRALIEAGWKPAGRGAAWYAHQFAWTCDVPPVASRSA